MSSLKHGDRVNIKKVYRTYNSQSNKIWKQVDFVRENCIFLGLRIIKTGKTHSDSEYGHYFVPKEHIKVMLVSVNAKENPVYVPL